MWKKKKVNLNFPRLTQDCYCCSTIQEYKRHIFVFQLQIRLLKQQRKTSVQKLIAFPKTGDFEAIKEQESIA